VAKPYKAMVIRAGKKVRSPIYYGKIKLGPRRWQNVPLFSDKCASERRLTELQREADKRAAGVVTPDLDRLKLPIDDLVRQYIDALKLERRDSEHLRITEWMTKKLLELGGWRFFSDVTTASMGKIVETLTKQGKTVSYINKYIVRAKALVHWLLPEGYPDPLAKLKRVREKGAKRKRERRAASWDELFAFYSAWPDLPPDRTLAYALALLNGLRRNEIRRDDARKLTWGDLSLNSPIPFVRLRKKQGDADVFDFIPLHPYVVKLLRERTPGMPGTPVCTVPDVKTLKKDLKRAGISLEDERGRLDFHGLRHTFSTNLDRTGCSRATRKKLKRHANEDVTDGYGHAELAEMLAALNRLPSPLTPQAQRALLTGTGGIAHDHGQDQSLVISQRSAALPDTMDGRAAPTIPQMPTCGIPLQAQDNSTVAHCAARPDLNESATPAIVAQTGPSTQVD
jgi:integrase